MKHRISAFIIDENGCKVFKNLTTIDTSANDTLTRFMFNHRHSFKTQFDVIAINNNGDIAYTLTYIPNANHDLTVKSYKEIHYNPKHKTFRILDDAFTPDFTKYYKEG